MSPNDPSPNDSSNFDRLIEQRLQLLERLPDDIEQSAPIANLDDHTSATTIHPRDNSTDDLTETATHRLRANLGHITVTGTAMLGQCPQCGAPLTIRTWLALADCWRCETSIAVNQLIVHDAPDRSPPTTNAAALPESSRRHRYLQDHGRQPQPKDAALATVVPSPKTSPATPKTSPIDELDALTPESIIAHSIRRFFSLSPAWIVSILLHLILLMVLGLIVLGTINVAPDTIVLSTDVSPDRRTGQGIQIDAGPVDNDSPEHSDQRDDSDPADQEQTDEDKQPDDDKQTDQKSEDAATRETNDANAAADSIHALADQLTIDRSGEPSDQQQPALRTLSALAPIGQVRSAVAGRIDATPFSARDPRLRSNVLRSEGGTLLTEAAVARGLKWLASVQNDDGSWSLKNYARHTSKTNKGDCMGTALALLPFLGAGQTHEWGIYQKTVAKGLNWMIRNQQPDGDLRAGLRTEAGMYAHGQAAIVLCEILAMTGDQQFLTPAQHAIDFIATAQGPDGGWRYRPGQKGDTSVLGWQMMALQSAKLAGMNLQVAPETFTEAGRFLDSVTVRRANGFTARAPAGTFYCYQRGRGPTEAMTAEAILCRMYLGAQRNDPNVRSAVAWLMAKHFPSRKNKNVYYWYYGSQVMHHYGGRNWRKWNQQVQTLLLETQSTEGRHAGSWNRQPFRWGSQGGRIYTTAMAVCTLEVYYRHLPLFRTIKL